ncbi:MAG TPA: hypothetical protein VLC98_11240 [Phnomibacter sp.]|nr:hypothetical protein [Phnomibacter sp.]
MQRIAMFLLVLLVAACQKDQFNDTSSSVDKAAIDVKSQIPAALTMPGVKSYLGTGEVLSVIKDLDWNKYALIRHRGNLVAVKIPFLNVANDKYKFILVNIANNKPTSIFLNELTYSMQNGQKALPEKLKNYDYQAKKWSIYDLQPKSAKKNAPKGVESLALIAPGGGSLPMVTIVGTSSNGSTVNTGISGTTAYLMAGIFGVTYSSGELGGASDPNYYQNFAYLDPLYTPDAGSNPLAEEVIYWELDESPLQPSIEIEQYLKCFDNIPNTGSTYSIKVMVDIPVNTNPNTLVHYDANGLSVGHVFMSITKTNGTKSVTQTFGFYPESGYKSIALSPVTSKMVDDGRAGEAHEYNAALTLNGWNTAEFAALLNQIRYNSTMKYELDGFNCANFIGSSLNAVRPGTLSSISVKGVDPNNTNNQVDVAWSPTGVYRALAEQKAYNPSLPITTDVVSRTASSSGPCY